MRPRRAARILLLESARSSRSPAALGSRNSLHRWLRRELRRLRWPEWARRWKARRPNTRHQMIGRPLRWQRATVCKMRMRRGRWRRNRAEILERLRRSLLEGWVGPENWARENRFCVEAASRTSLLRAAAHLAGRGKSSLACQKIARGVLRRATNRVPRRGRWMRGSRLVHRALRELGWSHRYRCRSRRRPSLLAH